MCSSARTAGKTSVQGKQTSNQDVLALDSAMHGAFSNLLGSDLPLTLGMLNRASFDRYKNRPLHVNVCLPTSRVRFEGLLNSIAPATMPVPALVMPLTALLARAPDRQVESLYVRPRLLVSDYDPARAVSSQEPPWTAYWTQGDRGCQCLTPTYVPPQNPAAHMVMRDCYNHVLHDQFVALMFRLFPQGANGPPVQVILSLVTRRLLHWYCEEIFNRESLYYAACKDRPIVIERYTGGMTQKTRRVFNGACVIEFKHLDLNCLDTEDFIHVLLCLMTVRSPQVTLDHIRNKNGRGLHGSDESMIHIVFMNYQTHNARIQQLNLGVIARDGEDHLPPLAYRSPLHVMSSALRWTSTRLLQCFTSYADVFDQLTVLNVRFAPMFTPQSTVDFIFDIPCTVRELGLAMYVEPRFHAHVYFLLQALDAPGVTQKWKSSSTLDTLTLNLIVPHAVFLTQLHLLPAFAHIRNVHGFIDVESSEWIGADKKQEWVQVFNEEVEYLTRNHHQAHSSALSDQPKHTVGVYTGRKRNRDADRERIIWHDIFLDTFDGAYTPRWIPLYARRYQEAIASLGVSDVVHNN
jgi:hypothetical protein